MKKSFLPIITGLLVTSLYAAEFQADFKPFQFSPRPQKGSIVDCSYLNTPITEAQRITVGKDGHLYAAGKRIRIFGTNLSAFPPVEDAAYWAQTLAAQGINCVRFHHTDSDWADCFFKHDSNWKLYFNEEAFERFDAFFYELKKAGIYSNINLLTGRNIKTGGKFTDLPEELNQISDWKDRHCYGFWNELAREDQRLYAQKILNHVNPYTGLSYAEDPAVAFVEINNENSMSKCYLDGAINRFPKKLTRELDQKWTRFLLNKGWTYEKLDSTFNLHQQAGENILSGKTHLEQHGGAKASLSGADGSASIKITANGSENWHIQYDFLNFQIEENQIYELSFRAKASKDTRISAFFMMNHEPWSNLGYYRYFELSKEWKDFSVIIPGVQPDSNPRLTFGEMGKLAGTTIQIENVQLRKGGEINNIRRDGKTILLPDYEDFKSLPLELRNLITEFLFSVDEDYWTSMNAYLKKDMNIKALTFGTIISCAPVSVVNTFDIIDAHAYWHHPSFPNASWNRNDFYIRNQSLLTAADGGTLSSLAETRIMGKPFSVTEYDHPYPNQFSSEMMPMYAVFASLQDWDCIYSFCYEISERKPEAARITGYFNQDSNPPKAAASPLAARIFREFRIAPLPEEKTYVITPETERRATSTSGNAWHIVPPAAFGIKGQDALSYRVGCYVEGDSAGARGAGAARRAGPDQTGQSASFTWNAQKGYFVYSDDDVFVSVSMPEVQGDFYAAEGIANYSGISFQPGQDFGAMAAVKNEAGEWLVYSASWSGNSGENLRPYGEKPGRSKTPLMTRENIKITSTFGGSKQRALTLGAEGKLIVPADQKWELYSLKENGTIGRKETDLQLKAEGGTLWYLLKKAD